MDTQNIILRSFEREDQENNRPICGNLHSESGKYLLVVKSREFWFVIQKSVPGIHGIPLTIGT